MSSAEGFVTMVVDGYRSWDNSIDSVSINPDSIGFSYVRYHDELAGSNNQLYSTDWISQVGRTY